MVIRTHLSLLGRLVIIDLEAQEFQVVLNKIMH